MGQRARPGNGGGDVRPCKRHEARQGGGNPAGGIGNGVKLTAAAAVVQYLLND